MAKVDITEIRTEIEVEPLTAEKAIEVFGVLVREGHRVELYGGTRDGESHYSLKLLVVEPIWGHQLRELCDLSDALGRPLTFNETEGIRIR
jgi:hypothetical protein